MTATSPDEGDKCLEKLRKFDNQLFKVKLLGSAQVLID